MSSAADQLTRERLRETIELLESIAADRSVLAGVPEEERKRLLQAVAHVYSPDRVERRRMAKIVDRQRKAARVKGDQGVLHETGIRSLRRKPVFHTPNVFPTVSIADGFQPQDIHDTRTPEPRAQSTEPKAQSPEPKAQSRELQHCYVCKQKYTLIHHFYDQLCPSCAEVNFRKRTELADLSGRVALLSGGRVKIGYQAGLKLLRCGAHLIVTTRFPRDAASRYANESDFAEWGHRLEIFGLDLRHTPSVEAFCRELLATRTRLDFIVNNACQTVRRPPDFYAHMMAGETAALHDMPEHVRRLVGSYEGLRSYHLLPEGGALNIGRSDQPPLFELRRSAEALAKAERTGPTGITHAAQLSQVPLLPEEMAPEVRAAQDDLFPEGRLDQDLQQIDLRGRNSWRLLLHEVPSVELLEVHLVNAVAPFIFNARLKPLLLRTPERDKHIVNVSAVEGQFYRNFKTTRHPHTNMAKAALNMMTRTAATDYEADGIHEMHFEQLDRRYFGHREPPGIALAQIDLLQVLIESPFGEEILLRRELVG